MKERKFGVLSGKSNEKGSFWFKIFRFYFIGFAKRFNGSFWLFSRRSGVFTGEIIPFKYILQSTLFCIVPVRNFAPSNLKISKLLFGSPRDKHKS